MGYEIMNCILKEDFNTIDKQYGLILDKLRGSKILITGSYGMITSFLCLFLIDVMEKYDLTLFLQGRNYSRLKERYGEWESTGRVNLCSFDFESGDIPDLEPDYIIHAASAASTKFFIESPVDVLSPNTVGTWNLLNYSKEKGIKKKHATLFTLFTSWDPIK